MMKTFRDTLRTIGDRGGDFVRAAGFETRRLARRFGRRTTRFGRRVDLRRGLMGLAMLAAAIGGSMALARHLRARKLRRLHETGADTSAGRTPK